MRLSPATVVLLLVMAVAVAINLVSIDDYPTPFCDEVQHIAVSHSFFSEGRFGVDYFLDFAAYQDTLPTLGRFYLFTKGLLFELLGYSYVTGRLYSVLGWLLGIAFTFLVADRLYGRLAAIGAAGILAVSNVAFLANHVGRPDVWAMTAGIGLVYYHLLIRERPGPVRYAFLGFLAVYAVEFHPNVVWIDLPLGLFVVLENYRSRETRPRIVAAAAGAGLAAFFVVLMQFLPDVQLAWEHTAYVAGENSLVQATGPANRLLSQLEFWRSQYTSMGGLSIWQGLLGVAGLGYAVFRRQTGDRYLLKVWGISTIAFALAMEHKSPFYGIMWEPYLALFTGAMGAGLAEAVAERSTRQIFQRGQLVAAFLLLASLPNLAGQLWISAKFAPRSFEDYTAMIVEHVPPGARVVGNVIFWPVFAERNQLIADSYFTRVCESDPDCTLSVAVIEELSQTVSVPGYWIRDGRVGCAKQTREVDGIFNQYLQAQCQLAAEVDDPWFGANGDNVQGSPTEIYYCPQTH